MIRDLEKIQRQIRKDWEQPEHVLALLNAISSRPNDDLTYLTVPIIMELARCESIKESTQIAEYLASERLRLLTPRFELIVGDHETAPLSDEDVYEALATGKLYHQGEEVGDWREHVVLFYVFNPDSASK